MSTKPTPTHLLIHRYTPGTGPQEGTPELDAEMKEWARIDQELRASGQLTAGWALHEVSSSLGAAESSSGTQVVFAVHAVVAESGSEAERIAARMPHLSYGSTEIHPVMS